MKRHLSLTFFVCSFFFSSNAFCSANVELDVKEIEKLYRNGDSIKLSCEDHNHKCELKYKEYGIEQSLRVDFDTYGLIPEMSQIALFRGDEFDHSAIAVIEVRCRASDVDSLHPSTEGAICLLEIHVRKGKIEKTPSIQILPITNMSIYKDLDSK